MAGTGCAERPGGGDAVDAVRRSGDLDDGREGAAATVVFGCAGCGAALTAPVSRVALPVNAHHTYGHQFLPPLMEPGTFAVDPEPFGPPWRPWDEVGADEAGARGVYAPVCSLSYGPRGAVVIAPGDVRGTAFVPDRGDGCLGLDGRDGPNLACVRCGRAVATRVDDCSYWQAVWLDPLAVRRLTGDDPPHRAADWHALPEGVPPLESSGMWSPLWDVAVSAALAHLLAVSAGVRVNLPDGLVAETFGPALDALLPPGPPARNLALAGPGRSTDADIALVPRHPRTGETWPYAGETVPLAAEVWAYLARHHDRRPVPGAGRWPDDAWRDDPPPLLPSMRFRPDRRVFLRTLARLPEVRAPWLRAIYDRVGNRAPAHPDPFW
ncbi:hypothetical protein [Actinoallomurus iriomotensis]|nr:hypothetical protein [Actinoallomurus iriomotensis]